MKKKQRHTIFNIIAVLADEAGADAVHSAALRIAKTKGMDPKMVEDIMGTLKDVYPKITQHSFGKFNISPKTKVCGFRL